MFPQVRTGERGGTRSTCTAGFNVRTRDDSATRATASSVYIAMAIPAMTWKAALMLLGAVATSTASALPQLAPAQEECDLRLWVRADDLSPSTIVEGDVRLLNNLTSLSDSALTACQIVDWSLVLRYRERAAMSIPLADIQLPEKPKYNYTWNNRSGRRQFKVDNIFSGGEDMASLFGNATDPYVAEKKDYNRRLEEYALALSSADKWIIQEEEVTFFETALSVNTSMETTEGECDRSHPEPAICYLTTICSSAASYSALCYCGAQCSIPTCDQGHVGQLLHQ